ncbi:hypothetical protein ACVWXM_001593 [Bradyrhizobium sp. GM7.3]
MTVHAGFSHGKGHPDELLSGSVICQKRSNDVAQRLGHEERRLGASNGPQPLQYDRDMPGPTGMRRDKPKHGSGYMLARQLLFAPLPSAREPVVATQ